MGCSRAAAACMAFVTVACFVVCLLPQVYWVRKNGDKISLWSHDCGKGCSLPNPGFTHHSEKTAERDGTIAACVLGGAAGLVAMFGAFCNKKAVVIGFSILSVIFSIAAIGAFYRYKTHTLDHNLVEGSYNFFIGFAVAVFSLVTGFVTMVCGACISSATSGYYQLA